MFDLRRCADCLTIRERLRGVEDRTTTFFRHVLPADSPVLASAAQNTSQTRRLLFFTDQSFPMKVKTDRCHSSSKIIHNVQEHPATRRSEERVFFSKKQQNFCGAGDLFQTARLR